jgi:hypothetical protein
MALGFRQTSEEEVGLRQATGGPDLVEALRRKHAEQLMSLRKHRVEVREVGSVLRDRAQRCGREAAESVVDPLHRRRRLALVVCGDEVVIEDDVRLSQVAWLIEERHDRRQSARYPAACHVLVVDAQDGVTVEDKKSGPEEGFGLADCTKCAVEPRVVIAITDSQSFSLVADYRFNERAKVANTEDDLPRSMTSEETELVREERLACYFEEGLLPRPPARTQTVGNAVIGVAW